MRGSELGLVGQDLLLYQTGEVIQVGAMIEKSLEKWIDDTRRWIGTWRDPMPQGFNGQIKLAKQILRLRPWSDQERSAMRGALTDTLMAMRERNRIVHDQWVVLEPGKVTRFGYFPPRDGFPGIELTPGIGKPEWTHEELEALRTLLFKCHWRLSGFTWAQLDETGDCFWASSLERTYELIRGEFDLTRESMRMWSAPIQPEKVT